MVHIVIANLVGHLITVLKPCLLFKLSFDSQQNYMTWSFQIHEAMLIDCMNVYPTSKIIQS